MRPLVWLALACVLGASCAATLAGERGLPEGPWLSFDEAHTHAERKPMLVLFTQPWCGACKKLKAALQSAPDAFFEAGAPFHLVSVEGDEDAAASDKRFQVDGAYIPRAYFVRPDGQVLSVTGPNERYRYFYTDVRTLTDAMQRAADELASADASDEL